MPFKINKGLNANWNKHKITDCFNFCDDLVKTIVPYIEKHYPVYNTIEHRSIYGSSLSAITALYLGFKYNTFKNICAFSTASFLNEESLINFLNDNIKIDRNVFLYVGKCEESDKIFDSTTYFDYSLRLYSYFINHDINTEVKIDDEGLHNETYWGKHLIDFFNFIAK